MAAKKKQKQKPVKKVEVIKTPIVLTKTEIISTDKPDDLIGLTYEHAVRAYYPAAVRISKKDGVSCILTRDFIAKRVNVEIKDNKIIKYTMG